MWTSELVTERVRITVDPNGVSRLNPNWSASMFEDADRVPSVGEAVFAVQPDEDGGDYVGNAVVKLIDRENKLIYIEVDWQSFAEQRDFIPSAELSINRVRTELDGVSAGGRLRATGLSSIFQLKKQHL